MHWRKRTAVLVCVCVCVCVCVTEVAAYCQELTELSNRSQLSIRHVRHTSDNREYPARRGENEWFIVRNLRETYANNYR